MALAALRAGQVEPGERPTGGGVIELPVCPQHRVVAEVARGWETGCHMVHGVRRGGVIVHVTRGANRVCAGQVVVIVDMALTALRAGQVEPGQRPTGSGVIEFAVGPEHRLESMETWCRVQFVFLRVKCFALEVRFLDGDSKSNFCAGAGRTYKHSDPYASPKLRRAGKSIVRTTSSSRQFAMTVP